MPVAIAKDKSGIKKQEGQIIVNGSTESKDEKEPTNENYETNDKIIRNTRIKEVKSLLSW